MFNNNNYNYNNLNLSLLEITRPIKRRKILLLGKKNIGKSAIINRYINNQFQEKYESTLENKIKKTITKNNEFIETEIIDIEGLSEFSVLPNKYLYGIDGYILLYSINDLKSFNFIKNIFFKLKEKIGDKKVKILVGCKCDLINERKVLYEEGKKFSKLNKCSFIESSSKENINIEKIFLKLLVKINKYEDGFDNNDIKCLKLIKIFIKNKKYMMNYSNIIFIFNLIFGIFYFIFGWIVLIKYKNIEIKGIIFILYGAILSFLEYLIIIALYKKEKENIKKHIIGMFLSDLIFIFINLTQFQKYIKIFNSNTNSLNIKIFLIFFLFLILNLTDLVISIIYYHIYFFNLESYFVNIK